MKIPVVSVFSSGYINQLGKAVLQCNPNGEMSMVDVYNYIKGEEAKLATERLRAETDVDKQREMKTLTLCYCTPFGTFSYRNAKGLKKASGLMVVDIDDVESQERLMQLREQLIHDKHFETSLLFISPRGHGLKWFIEIGDMGGKSLRDFFPVVARHVAFHYGIDIDQSGKDVPRPCYLSHDPLCYINEKYLKKNDSL
ncbi:MAG: virulence protein E [Bacteroidaceae bacterium]|nr:virulence protein E [Bacteroidaceae bacterium]